MNKGYDVHHLNLDLLLKLIIAILNSKQLLIYLMKQLHLI